MVSAKVRHFEVVAQTLGPDYEARIVITFTMEKNLNDLVGHVAEALCDELREKVIKRLEDICYEKLEQPVLASIKQESITTLALSRVANRIADKLGEK